MKKVVIIGAGASGVIAALKASEKSQVILVDSNDKTLKKLLLTGNGRCNYWNDKIEDICYTTDNKENLKKILSKKEEVFSYLTSIGIVPKVINGYYYPRSNQAASIKELLDKKIQEKKIELKLNFKVTDIKKSDKFKVISEKERIENVDKVVIATGSCAYPKTGSTGDGYTFAKNMHHTILEVSPSLVPLKGSSPYFKMWDGTRFDATVTLQIDGKKVKEETGEVQFTDYGISGIPTLNISSLASIALKHNQDVRVKINFLKEEEAWLENRNNMLNNPTLETLLETVIPYKLIFTILKYASLKKEDKWDHLSKLEKQKLIEALTSFEIKITDTLSFDRSQVATGGVPLSEINPNTMESVKEKGLYFIGEVLNVDGICGGLNLAFAFITGYLMGDKND